MKSIGTKLKELREENNFTRKEVADKLKEIGIDISDKTLYGYESGRNSANADMFLALCKIYKCNNIMEIFTDSVDDVLFTNEEWLLIEKYRTLDEHGHDIINTILMKEYDRCQTNLKNIKNINQLSKSESLSDNLRPVAAHERTDIEVTNEMRQSDDELVKKLIQDTKT